MALTRDNPRRFETSSFSAALASTAIYQGACVASVRASGQAAGGAFADATHRFAGFAATRAAIGERVTLQPKGRVILTVAGSSAASANAVVYASDDDSFNLTGTGVAIGRVAWVQDDGKCVVDFDAGGEASAPGITTMASGSKAIVGLDGLPIRLTETEIVAVSGPSTSLASGYTAGSAATGVDLGTTVVDTDGALVDLTNNYIIVPANATKMKVAANVIFDANATGKRYVALEQYFAAISTWLPITGFYDERNALATGKTPVNFVATLSVITPASFPRVRIAVGQDSGAPLNYTLVGATFEFMNL